MHQIMAQLHCISQAKKINDETTAYGNNQHADSPSERMCSLLNVQMIVRRFVNVDNSQLSFLCTTDPRRCLRQATEGPR